MNILRTHKVLLTSSLLSIAASLLCRRTFPMVLLTIGIIVAYFPFRLFAESVVFRILVALTTLLCLIQMEAMAFWILKIWIAPPVSVITTLTIVALSLWLLNRKRDGASIARIKLGWIDALLILPALIIGGVYVFGTLAPQEKDTVTITRSVMYGMDDGTHAIIFSDTMRHGTNLLAGKERGIKMSKGIHSSYPMGWHVATSVIATSIVGENDQRTPIQTLTIYFYAKVLTFALTIAMVTAFIYQLSRTLWTKGLNPFVTFCSLAGISVFVSSLLVLPMFFEGFFSFMPIITFTVLFVMILMRKQHDAEGTIILTLLAGASSLTWMLTGPILIAVLVLFYFRYYGSLRQIPARIYWAAAVGSICMLFQMFILYTADNKSIQNIANEGGISNPEHLLLAVCLIAFFVLFMQSRKIKTLLPVVESIFVTSIVFLAANAILLLYLTTKSSEITYYYFKLQVPILILLLPPAILYGFTAIMKIGQMKKLTDQMTMAAVSFILLAIAIPSVIGYQYVYDIVNRAHSYVISPSDGAILANDILSKKISNSNERTYFMFPNDPARNILPSNIDKFNYRSTRCDFSLSTTNYGYDVGGFDKVLSECAGQFRVKVYTDRQGQQDILKSLDPTLIQKHDVELVVI